MEHEELSLSEFFTQYERSWQRVSAEWKQMDSGTHGWLTYAAN